MPLLSYWKRFSVDSLIVSSQVSQILKYNLNSSVGVTAYATEYRRINAQFAEYLKKNYAEYQVHAAYEAACFGFKIQRDLQSKGINTIVINPGDIPKSDKDKRNKTDKIDSKTIAKSLKSEMVTGIHTQRRK